MKDLFTHLSLRTAYSLIDSTIALDALIKKAKKQKVTALAITDFVNTFNAIKFYQACIRNKIKPIIGCQIPISNFEYNSQQPFVTLLCKSQKGYKNLIRLISDIHVNKLENKLVSISIEDIEKYSQDLILCTGGYNGIIGKNLLSVDLNVVKSNLILLNNIFKNNLYIEIQKTNHVSEKNINNKTLKVSQEMKVPIIATNNVLFVNKDDFESHEVKVCINKKIKLDDRIEQVEYTEDQYFKTPDEMKELFYDLPDSIANVGEIIKRCNLKLTLDTYHMPEFNAPDGIAVDNHFENVVRGGLEIKLSSLNKSKHEMYYARLNSEMSVIKKMGFTSYFLIVHEFIAWAKNNHIPVGPGRGSGAGSLVAYSLGITSVDPLPHNLLFERFLNSDRISMPDFDIDFCMVNRQKVIEHISEKYGNDKVSQIITHGSLAARAVIRDVGRVLGMGYTSVDKIAKLVPFTPGITIDDALKQNKELKKKYDSSEEIKNLIDTSKKIEGLPRNVGKHAAGIVISPNEISNHIPLYRVEESGEIVTQYDKDDIEKLGLVKFDILGLRTLSIIDKTIRNLRLKKISDIDIDTIIPNDPKVYSLMQKKLTTGVFQLESSGMKRYMGQLKPDCFDDIVALVALYRPGPLGTNMVDDFINNKHGKKINYEHPSLEPILSPTYGLILYQEQVMEISRALANYTLGEADILRRAMGKKKKEEMENQRQKFLSGAKKNKISEHIAESIFSKMEKFAGYGFNKSHSVAYAYISYQTALLKTYHPSEFLASALSSDMDNTDKVISLIRAANEMDIRVVKPDINKSSYEFQALDDKVIMFGLGAIKGVGLNAVKHLVIERERNGPFNNIFEFCERVSHSVINIAAMDALIFSGACDLFDVNRIFLKRVLDKALTYGQKKQLTKTIGQTELFASDTSSSVARDVELSEKKSELTRETRLEVLQSEKKVLGLYLSGHPIAEYQSEIKSMGFNPISFYLNKINDGIKENYSEYISLSGVIVDSRMQRVGSDRFINILSIDDSSGSIEVIIYPDIYDKYRDMLKENEILFVTGNISIDEYNGSLSLKASSIVDIDFARQHYSKKIELLITSDKTNDETIGKLMSILEPHKNGKCPLIIKCISKQHIVPLSLDEQWHINPTSVLINNLTKLLGSENIIVKYQ